MCKKISECLMKHRNNIWLLLAGALIIILFVFSVVTMKERMVAKGADSASAYSAASSISASAIAFIAILFSVFQNSETITEMKEQRKPIIRLTTREGSIGDGGGLVYIKNIGGGPAVCNISYARMKLDFMDGSKVEQEEKKFVEVPSLSVGEELCLFTITNILKSFIVPLTIEKGKNVDDLRFVSIHIRIPIKNQSEEYIGKIYAILDGKKTARQNDHDIQVMQVEELKVEGNITKEKYLGKL